MKTIAIINLKGGVGKTTTAINMAALLAEKYKKRVLLIDNDPQGNASQFCRCYKWMNETCGAAKILKGENPQKLAYRFIDVINADMTLLEADNALRASTERQDDKIKQYLQNVAWQYDYCIIDNPPALLMCTINALCAADEVIIPVTLDNWSLDGVETITEQIEALKVLNDKLKVEGILITNYKKTTENEAAEKWLREKCGYRVYNTVIRRSDKITAATYHKKPIDDYSPRSAAAVTYRRFVIEYLQESGDGKNGDAIKKGGQDNGI